MPAYYNEIDPYCVQWLRNLIAEGLIAPGDVDERPIQEVQPSDLAGYVQCHFFAGIGGWSYALRLARWPDDRPVWTGSCPCQPFSAAGKQKASGDERHLWPEWFRLIRACQPATIFGEQVEAAIGWGWLDLVYADLEAEGYTVGASVLPACGVGAPHIRQRLWFVADAKRRAAERRRHDLARSAEGVEDEARQRQRIWPDTRPSGTVGELADADASRCRNHWHPLIWLPCTDGKQRPTGVVAESDGGDASAEGLQRGGKQRQQPQDGGTSFVAESLPTGRAEARSECAAQPNLQNRRQRPTQSIIQPLAHGVPARVAKLRAIGNAICPEIAAEFIKAAM